MKQTVKPHPSNTAIWIEHALQIALVVGKILKIRVVRDQHCRSFQVLVVHALNFGDAVLNERDPRRSKLAKSNAWSVKSPERVD